MKDLAVRNNSGLGLFDEDFFASFFNLGWNIQKEFGMQEPAHYFYDEEKKQNVITVQAPGFSKEEIQIDVDEKGISIEGELKNEELIKRIGQKKFSYQMRKPGIDSRSVEASLKDGILEIRLKTQESKPTKKIEIK